MEDKRDFLFRFIPIEKRKLLRFDDEAFYSVTDQYTADKISRELKKQCPDAQLITDGTACVGGNSFSFSKHFPFVQAIELDKIRFDYLKANLQTLETINVACYWGDCLDVVPYLKQDLVFLDPPWGGPSYKDKKSIDLYLSGVELSEICKIVKPYCSYLALKVPQNFALERFNGRVERWMNLVYRNTELRKMQLLIYV
jgi:predicted RNA methylase